MQPERAHGPGASARRCPLQRGGVGSAPSLVGRMIAEVLPITCTVLRDNRKSHTSPKLSWVFLENVQVRNRVRKAARSTSAAIRTVGLETEANRSS